MATGLNGGGPDPDFYVYRYFTDDGNLNFVTSYKNPVSSDAIKQARASTDPAKRKDLYTTAQKELVNGVPFIWLFVGRTTTRPCRPRRVSSTYRPARSSTYGRPAST